MLINLKDKVKLVMDNRFQFYSPEEELLFLSNGKFRISAKHINFEVWYDCNITDEDGWCYDEYDFSSRDLREVLEWCNEVVPETFMYY